MGGDHDSAVRGEVLKVKENALELLYWDKNQPMVYKRE